MLSGLHVFGLFLCFALHSSLLYSSVNQCEARNGFHLNCFEASADAIPFNLGSQHFILLLILFYLFLVVTHLVKLV